MYYMKIKQNNYDEKWKDINCVVNPIARFTEKFKEFKEFKGFKKLPFQKETFQASKIYFNFSLTSMKSNMIVFAIIIFSKLNKYKTLVFTLIIKEKSG